ncbi:integrase arm-type DNA-binding domain-containing protein [Caballeronia sp. LZ062]|uniref:tyrosine-type recombinase/integrase n=1 Tax=unclassified Caballeronia TaxID=2646786 RepID=UPI00285432E1|nr:MULTISPECIES: integrase arm-type DNA-binding domain-containing protein [unclassified Caballeronia]MDR5855980.1 integrase arm-type DNA-binding domain-containing protein [Caballeronia sp. LZ050]MDR5872234.1 integrase arm-type DNA-binding domain-containing protein [Caballeronia sp. LZ062]
MALTDVNVRNAKPRDKLYRLFDERGMYLEISTTGGKWWRLKYRFGGKEKRLSLGVYPDVGLKEARDRRDEARKLLAKGVDPSIERKVQKAATIERAANSFEAVAREWFARQAPGWAASHSDKIMGRLEKDVFPWLGGRPIAEIKPPEVLAVLRRVEARGALDTAHRVHQNCGQVFRYAVATGRAERDISSDLRGALPPARHTHFASVTEPAEVASLLRALDGFKGTFVVQCALRLAPLLFVRPGELRTAEWAQFDLEKAQWRYTVSKTKTEHLVPLPTQAVAMLRDLYALTGHRQYVFPGRDVKKPMSGAAINAALRRMGFDTKTEITGHGFRAMARTILHEQLRFPSEVIEHQLAHKVPDALGSAYNRTKFIDDRIVMMQRWADYLDELKSRDSAVSVQVGENEYEN